MNKEKIVVSAEVKTFLMDLYNQIEYELREDYKDSLEKTTQALLDIKEYIEKHKPKYDYIVVNGWTMILDIVNKALGGDDNE